MHKLYMNDGLGLLSYRYKKEILLTKTSENRIIETFSKINAFNKILFKNSVQKHRDCFSMFNFMLTKSIYN